MTKRDRIQKALTKLEGAMEALDKYLDEVRGIDKTTSLTVGALRAVCTLVNAVRQFVLEQPPTACKGDPPDLPLEFDLEEKFAEQRERGLKEGFFRLSDCIYGITTIINADGKLPRQVTARFVGWYDSAQVNHCYLDEGMVSAEGAPSGDATICEGCGQAGEVYITEVTCLNCGQKLNPLAKVLEAKGVVDDGEPADTLPYSDSEIDKLEEMYRSNPTGTIARLVATVRAKGGKSDDLP